VLLAKIIALLMSLIITSALQKAGISIEKYLSLRRKLTVLRYDTGEQDADWEDFQIEISKKSS
jgi:hypothetical protein